MLHQYTKRRKIIETRIKSLYLRAAIRIILGILIILISLILTGPIRIIPIIIGASWILLATINMITTRKIEKQLQTKVNIIKDL